MSAGCSYQEHRDKLFQNHQKVIERELMRLRSNDPFHRQTEHSPAFPFRLQARDPEMVGHRQLFLNSPRFQLWYQHILHTTDTPLERAVLVKLSAKA
eukprot:gene3255-3563_t